MTTAGTERLAFNVDTGRILQILASEIYDSPKAFLRENVQNAYDAILMRCTAQNLRIEDRRIEITVDSSTVTVRDDGIGMDEEVLANNFWEGGLQRKEIRLGSAFWSDRNFRNRCYGQFWGSAQHSMSKLVIRIRTLHLLHPPAGTTWP